MFPETVRLRVAQIDPPLLIIAQPEAGRSMGICTLHVVLPLAAQFPSSLLDGPHEASNCEPSRQYSLSATQGDTALNSEEFPVHVDRGCTHAIRYVFGLGDPRAVAQGSRRGN
jgi:hypothetical protein